MDLDGQLMEGASIILVHFKKRPGHGCLSHSTGHASQCAQNDWINVYTVLYCSTEKTLTNHMKKVISSAGFITAYINVEYAADNKCCNCSIW